MNKIEAAILTVLEELGAPVHRTKLVKLIYLADNLFYEHFGNTLTGLEYMWDNHGPNAISNATVKETNNLVEADLSCVKIGTSIYGSENYLYSLGPNKTDAAERILSPIEKQVLRDTVKRYRGYSLPQIVAASKKTAPFKGTHQYMVLKMTQSSDYTNLLETLKDNTEFMAAIAEGTKADAEANGMRLEEVKQKYDL